MSMSAEFNLLARAVAGPTFSIVFKPRFGDFSIRKTTRSPAASAPPVAKKIAVDPDTDGEGSVVAAETTAMGFRPVNGILSGWKPNGFATGVPTAGSIHGLLSGVEVTARSVLPLRSRAVVRFRWGLRVPAELRTAFAEDGSGSGISLGKLPRLVMSKISIEHVAAGEKAKGNKTGGGADELAEACMSVKRQLEALQAENGLLRKSVEELRAEVGGGKAALASANQVPGGAEASKGGAKPVAAGKRDRRTDGKPPEFAGKVTPEDVNEELKKALMGATGAGI